MKKNILISILLVLIGLLTIYGYVKSEEAWKNLEIAAEQSKLIEQKTTEVIAAQERVEDCVRELEECQSK